MFSSRALQTLLSKTISLTLLIGLWAISSTQAMSSAPDIDRSAMEEVLVVGRRPGPPMWRAVSGDNTLWIFATLQPLPTKLRWDNSSVKHLLNESSVFIEPPDISASTNNIFKALGTLRKLKKLEKLEGDTRLKDVVPPELYQKFRLLKKEFAPNQRGIERLRPMPAAEKLMEGVFERAGLTTEDRIYPRLLKMAKRRKLDVLSSTSEVALAEVVEIFSGISMDAEIACLESALNTIAIDLHASMERANAWAEGDAQQLLRLNYPDADQVCSVAISNTPVAQQAMLHSKQLWLAHARAALESHKTSVTSLPIAEIAQSDGLLADLRRAGYEIRGQ